MSQRVTWRKATHADIPALRALIATSARALTSEDYTSEQIEAALESAWGVDSQLIEDGTYLVGEDSGAIVACGGWSWRATQFGGDHQPDRAPQPLDPALDSARIRAFFIHPAFARRGLGQQLLQLCESAARAAGFGSVQLVATLPGERLYAAFGYRSHGAREYPLGHGQSILFVPMSKRLEHVSHPG